MTWLAKLWPTKSLFGRIFLWFWFVSLVLIVGSSWVVRQVITTAELKPIDPATLSRFEGVATTVERQLNDKVGAIGIESALRNIARAKGMPMLLVSRQNPNRMVALPPPMIPAAELVAAMVEEPSPRLIQTLQANFIGPYPIVVDDEPFVLFSAEPKALAFLFSVQQAPFGLPLLVLLLSGVFCFLLVWTLVRPIKNLQQAARKMAAGDLGITIDEEKLGGDEIGQLGRDFNRMSQQVRDQMAAQKRLLADISHELRSPLTRQQVAIDLAQKIAEKQKEDSLVNALARITTENNRLNEMIEQLLKLSRLEAMPAPQFQPVAVKSTLEELLVDARFEAKAVGKEVNAVHINESTISACPELLCSAIENVLRNAIRYAARQVTVSTSATDASLTICIEDDGEGVDHDSVDALFKPFVRYSNARDRDSGGVGLGLAIAKQAIDMHSGQIRAENKPDGGLRVCIALPLNRQ